jgi:hypothetical protein
MGAADVTRAHILTQPRRHTATTHSHDTHQHTHNKQHTHTRTHTHVALDTARAVSVVWVCSNLRALSIPISAHALAHRDSETRQEWHAVRDGPASPRRKYTRCYTAMASGRTTLRCEAAGRVAARPALAAIAASGWTMQRRRRRSGWCHQRAAEGAPVAEATVTPPLHCAQWASRLPMLQQRLGCDRVAEAGCRSRSRRWRRRERRAGCPWWRCREL